MKRGIVGNGMDKFTDVGRKRAIELIESLMSPEVTIVSGHSPVGGVDIWAEYAARTIGAQTLIFAPSEQNWEKGYKARNLLIAQESDEVHVIVADSYPEGYSGRRFKTCYHCAQGSLGTPWHIKSGGCWTGWKALNLGKPVVWHVIRNL